MRTLANRVGKWLLIATTFTLAPLAMAASPEPVAADHGMVVSAHRLATEAGLDVLRHGGNAIDAAVAVGYALAVTFPEAGNLGGGGFMTLRQADGTTHFLDFRETAPGAARADMYLDKAGNVIPGSVELLFNFRYSTASPADGLRERVTAILARHGLEYRLSWDHSAQPFLTPRGALVDALRASILASTGVHAEVSTTGGTSDGRFIARWAREVGEFGPVNASIHKIDEQVRVADLPVLAAVYGGLITRLLGGATA